MGFSPYDFSPYDISPQGSSFDFMFSIVPVIVLLGFILVFGYIIVAAIRGGIQWNNNNNSPVLTVDAKVVAKRTTVDRRHHHHGDDMSMHHMSSSTTYYVTFEMVSRDRMELRVPDREYGMLAEGDTGKLTFQGTRYKGFERERW